jgi:antitoxin VapB
VAHLNIKSDEAHRLATQLAEARGSNLTEAVTAALSMTLRAERTADAGVDTLLAEVRQVQQLVADLPDRDRRDPDEILGYDELGMPV